MLARRVLSALLFRHRPISTSRIIWAQHSREELEEVEADGERNLSWHSSRRKSSHPSLDLSNEEEGGEMGGQEDEGEESDSSSFIVPKVLRAYLRSRRSRCISRVREQGRVPAVLVNDDGDHGSNGNILLSLDAKPVASILKFLGKRDFVSRVFDMHIYRNSESDEIKESLQVLPRNLNYGEGKTNILNIQFIRANPNRILKLGVPLEYLGLDKCPGLEKGGTLKRLAKYVVYNCKATEVPAKIVVDTTILEIGDRVLVQDLEVDYDLLSSDRTMPVCEIIKDEVTLTAKSKRLKNEILHSKKALCKKDDAPMKQAHFQTLSSDDECNVDDDDDDDNKPYKGRIRSSAFSKAKVNSNGYVNGDVMGEEPQSKHKKLKTTYRRKRAPEGRKPSGEGVSSGTNPLKKVKLSKRRLMGSSAAVKKPVKPTLKEKNN